MNLPSGLSAAAFSLLLFAAFPYAAETPPDAETRPQTAMQSKTGKTSMEEAGAKPDKGGGYACMGKTPGDFIRAFSWNKKKGALLSVFPPFTTYCSWFWPFWDSGKGKDAGVHPQTAIPSKTWETCMAEARAKLGKGGGYACTGKALGNFIQAFSWNEKKGRRLQPGKARPSFCSSAVYGALLLALDLWDSGREKTALDGKAWQALAPKRVPDGTGPWGCANANGPGLAVLVHQLDAGYSFTEWEKAQSGDIMKLWWTEAIGARERGHLTIYLSQTEDSLTFWSSNQSNPEGKPGYGTKTVSKSTVKHVLFTRITRPEAFANAPSIGTDPWLGSLLKKTVTAEEMLRHCGLSPSSSEIHP